MDTCLKINQKLQELLSLAYSIIYADSLSVFPTFTLPVVPIVPYDTLVPLFDAQLLDDSAYSRIFEASTGFPLGSTASQARNERHQALHIKPFLEEKVNKSSKK